MQCFYLIWMICVKSIMFLYKLFHLIKKCVYVIHVMVKQIIKSIFVIRERIELQRV